MNFKVIMASNTLGDMIVSIIVPVYNVEKYIRQCLDSILAQTFIDFEVICVDDCSPDNSGIICNEYAAKDKRIKVIHNKENGGVSKARQIGKIRAQGEWTIHIDPDDWVEPDMLESLVCHAYKTDADIVICDYWSYSNNLGNVYKSLSLEAMPTSESVLKKLVFNQVPGCCWNKLIRRDVIKDINFLDTYLTIGEDQLFNIKVLNQPNVVVSYLSQAFYHYRQISHSLVHTISQSKLDSKIKMISELEKILPTGIYNGFYHLKREAIYYAFEIAISGAFKAKMFERLRKLYPEIQEDIIAEGTPYRWGTPTTSCLSIALRGAPYFAYFLFKINMWCVCLKRIWRT